MSSQGQGAVLARIRDRRGEAGIPVAIARQARELARSGATRPVLLQEAPPGQVLEPRRVRRARAREART
jgi:hypothetical protein